MKTARRLIPLLLVAALILSILTVFAYAAYPAAPAVNSKTRHTVATSLSADAQAYYTGSYSYANLSALAGASNTSDSYAATQNNPLYTALQTLMTDTQTFNGVKYSGSATGSLAYYWDYTDAVGGTNGYIMFYSDVGKSGYTMNREHIWPKSRASYYETNGGSDLHHLRPAVGTLNNAKSNHMFGYVKDVYSGYTTGTVGGNVAYYLYASADRFECLDNVKGDVARILLYIYVRWGQPNLYSDVDSSHLPAMDADDSQNSGERVIESLSTLLEWCELDPVDTWEMERNDLTQDVQGNRNVFIDYPEFAWQLFGLTAPSDMPTPSGMASSGSGSGSGGSTGGSTGSTGYTLVSSTPADWSGDYVLVGKSGTTYYVLDASGSITGTSLGSAAAVRTLADAGITMDGDTLTGVSDDYVYTVSAAGSGYSFRMKNADCYLNYKSSGLTTATSNSAAEAQWLLSAANDKTTAASLSATSYKLLFNASSKLFRCYSNNSYALYLYKASGSTGGSSGGGSAPSYTVTASSNNTGYGTVSVDGYTVTATPATGYKVDGYTITSGSATVSQSGNVFTLVPTANTAIRINFVQETYTVTASTNNSNYGTVSVNGYTVTASPTAGYKVNSYSITSGSATVTQNGNVFTLAPTSNTAIRINFAKETYTVSASVNSSSYGSVSVSGYTVTAYPADGYEVDGYTITSGSATVSQSGNVFTLVPTSNTAIRINFTPVSTGTTYTLVTSAPTDWSGDYVLVGKSGTNYYVLDASGSITGTSLGSTSASKTLSAAGITMNGNTLSGVSDDYVYTVGKSSSYYYFKMKGSTNYLSFKASGLTTGTGYGSNATKWSLAVASTGKVTMTNRSSTSYKLLFNTSSKLFRCYTSSTYALYLYKAD